MLIAMTHSQVSLQNLVHLPYYSISSLKISYSVMKKRTKKSFVVRGPYLYINIDQKNICLGEDL